MIGKQIYSATTGGAAQVASYVGSITGFYFYNTTASVIYIQMFPLVVGSVTLGTTTPKMVFAVPASSGVVMRIPYRWNAPLTIGTTTTRTGGTTAAGDINLFYET